MSSARELRAMTDVELSQKLHEAYQELFNLRFRLATKQLENTSRIRFVQHEIARIKTIMRQREPLSRDGERQLQAEREV